MPTWTLRQADEAAVDRLEAALGVPRAIARVLVLRGLTTPQDALNFRASRESLSYLETPIMTPGMEKAVARIRRAVAQNEPFVIYGDYDCDGVTSAAVLYRYLKRGLKANVEAYLPDRFKDGYGVTPQAVERIAKSGVKLILTCDNGISAVAAAEKAKEYGVEIVVTDHHQVPEVLPDVHAIVHPQLEFKHLKDLAGVGVAYLFVLALEGGMNARMETFLDFVTLGTVGDVVPLDGPNRPLVWAGLERYRNARTPYPGVKELIKVAKANWEGLTAQDVGFQLVPRLNAAGRLETPDMGFRLLATNDHEEAAACAEHLDGVNRQRRDMSAELEASVIARLEREWDFDNEPFIVLSDQEFHHGITGIIAGRLKERYRLPVLLFSAHDETIWKASGRAPDGVHLYEALHAARGHLLGFGGHAGAAGCSAVGDALPHVRKSLNNYLAEIGWTRPEDAIWLDAELPFAEATEELLAELDNLEPFGQRNPLPVFGLLHARVVNKRVRGNHLFLTLDDGRDVREVVAWGKGPEADQLTGWVRVTFTPKISLYGGRHVELVAQRLEPTSAPAAVTPGRSHAARTAQTVADRRGEDLGQLLAELEATTSGPIQLYSLPGRQVPGGRVRVVDALAPKATAGPMVLADVPQDQDTWEALAAQASPLILAWPELAEEALTPAWLTELYMALAREPGTPLAVAVGRQPMERRHAAIAALRVLREAGLLVERDGRHQPLAAPDEGIALATLPAFQAAREAEAFRAKLRAAPVAAIAPGRPLSIAN
ncbi:MAG: single-stranded-DNA-specific exonuclease RecJ [Cyanobacteria bacterium RYN_339]|nr:single-stranded-DNA-specific exonuclease RecJ [Cyanobacteria bacterium RYN_339]